jgi:hypothetical protein
MFCYKFAGLLEQYATMEMFVDFKMCGLTVPCPTIVSSGVSPPSALPSYIIPHGECAPLQTRAKEVATYFGTIQESRTYNVGE